MSSGDSPRGRVGRSPGGAPLGSDASSPLPYQASSSPAPPRSVTASSPLPFGSSQATPHGTPTRSRGDLGGRRLREVDLVQSSGSDDPSRTGSTDAIQPTSDGGALHRTMIWGTTVNVQDTMAKFTRFFSNFLNEQGQPKYPRLLTLTHESGESHLDLDCNDLLESDRSLYHQLVRYPQEVITIFDMAIADRYESMFHEAPTVPLQVRTYNLAQVTSMRQLNPEDIDQLVAIRGMVIRTSPIIPDPKEGFFQCAMCKFTAVVPIDNGRIIEPTTCTRCTATRSMTLVHNRCRFADKQMIKLQETPENVPDGQTPQTVLAYAFDELVDNVQPGDRVELTGIYRATTLRLVARQRTVKSVFKTHIDVIHFKKTSSSRLKRDDDADQILDPAVEAAKADKLKELSQMPDIYDRLVRALAPNIFEFDDVKRGVLCQLFGGVHKQFSDTASGRCRGEIHVLLCGDPGTSKSQLLQYAVNLASRGIYTSGRGSSSVGLTAYVTKDPETKQIVLESGALVLCDGGVCCIDEFDKMGDSTRSVLHEVMEQQTVSVAKAGIICSLNARTSILAAANPQESKWNPQISIVDNIQLPPALLSRFDLIYLILDSPDRNKDRRLARHMVSLYYPDAAGPASRDGVIDRETLAAYISYARKNIHPVLTDEASHDLIAAYVEMRKLGTGRGTVTATPRQLESLIRLAEAHARMRFAKNVEASDVSEAVSLVRAALQQAATDPRTGLVDLDLITTGQSAAARRRIGDLGKAIAELLGKRKARTVTLNVLQKELSEATGTSILSEDLRAALDQLVTDEVVSVTGAGARAPNPTIKFLAAVQE
eukprot:m.226726 g.226726  ORF g.226726 m.226726 type:complete len:825 (+) comp11469_c0_seq1:44-2518(+)